MDDKDKYVYLYLDFNEKLTPNIFENELFLRVANLHKSNPLVQINDLVFKGTYDECVGTNLFFEEIEDPPLKTNIYERETAICLKHVLTQTKAIRLKQMKLSKKILITKHCKESNLNLDQDYSNVLEKLEQGILNLEDLAIKEAEEAEEKCEEGMNFDNDDEVQTEPEKEVDSYMNLLENSSSTSILDAKYERLKRLARRPVKRMKSPELIAECEPQYKAAYEYHNLERQVLQNSDAFRSVSCPIIEENFVGGIDVDRCVLQGLLPSQDFNRTLTKEDLSKLLTLDNLENLSIPARYLVLKECVSKIEELIENTPNEELKEVDENGRTVEDICNVFKKLVSALEHLMSRTSGNSTEMKVKLDVSQEKDEEKYVKYKYKPCDLVIECPDILNDDEWVDADQDITIKTQSNDTNGNKDWEDSDDSNEDYMSHADNAAYNFDLENSIN